MSARQRTGIWDRGFGVIGIGWMLAALVGCKLLPSSDSNRVLFPASNVPNYQQLISVHWLKSLLDYQQSGNREKRPETYENDHFVVLEVSWASLENASDYQAGHVPGAIHLNTDDLENGSPRWRFSRKTRAIFA